MSKTRGVGVAASRDRRGRGKQARQGGGTLLGFLAGLIVGLGIAVVVALFVTRAPVPFVNKGNRSAERMAEPRNGAVLPDPNAPLQSRPREGTPAMPAPAPSAPSGPSASGSLPPPVASPAPGGLPAPPLAAPAPAPADTLPADGGGYVLQAGAFRSSDDAEGMKARLALLGIEARVMSAEINGQTMYRVRIGPFAQQDEANRARARLADGGIEASVIRQR